MRSLYADPKNDFVFKRLFGTESNKDLLIALLNDLLETTAKRAIINVEYLREEQRPRIPEMKYSAVDVKCQEKSGRVFVVEMQVLNVEGFEKRVVYNGSKAYVNQLDVGVEYGELNDVVAVSICDFVLWPAKKGKPEVPLLSRWRMKEVGGRDGLSQIQYVFVELPKLSKASVPKTPVEQWVWLFRNAASLDRAPTTPLATGPKKALIASQTAAFTRADWEDYERAAFAQQDAKNAFILASKQGRAEGLAEGKAAGLAEGKAEGKAEGLAEGELRTLRRALMLVLNRRFGAAEVRAVEECSESATLETWLARATTAKSLAAVFRPSRRD